MNIKFKKPRTCWHVPASAIAKNTINPIRRIVDEMKLTPNPEKDMIALSIGDPTVYGNLHLPAEAENAVIESLQSQCYNGYGPSVGHEKARAAVAAYTSTLGAKIEAKDVVLTSGCSGALDLCITVLANPGQNILVPRPGFSLYKTIANSMGIEVQFYSLIPEKSWEIDLCQLESLINENTAAIVVCNPSNPCGSVFNQTHIQDIINMAGQHMIPIIADEVYEHLVFSGHAFFSLASLSTDVPVLTCGGIAKRFIVPGWRLGWIIIHDRNDVFKAEVRQGLTNLSQRILGPNTIIQGALESILRNTPQTFFSSLIGMVEANAVISYNALCKIRGLKPIMPQGALYMMVGISIEKFPEFKSDLDFTKQLVTEQSVFCLPASCFQYPNFFRIVLTVPQEKLQAACNRIQEFCSLHFLSQNGSID